ncbi:hypothetical protein RHGRI_001365 [Rhododendron griersonianum]|uniref:PLAC8 family protein n=1 Tax=Rhododendron griersonianum TaxID=479676 RepID=A0AAV6LN35_9ERIC|nr:hypothetical protein RHGRI_001365 [Rhododendron griersonianum]
MAEGTYVKLTPEQASLQNITPGELNQPIDIARLTARRCQNVDKHFLQPTNPLLMKIGQLGFLVVLKMPEVVSVFYICFMFQFFSYCALNACFCQVLKEIKCWTGLFCPCVLFGRNIETLKGDISERAACIGHVICVEGGMTAAAVTSVLHGIDPQTMCLIYEGLFFAWWMCGIYTSMARQSVQKKYHLKDSPCDPCMVHCCLHWCAICQEHREMKGRLADNTTTSATVVDPPPVQEMDAIQDKKASSSSSEEIADHNNLQIQPQ